MTHHLLPQHSGLIGCKREIWE